MESSPKTLATLATYNEIDNLPRLVEEILAVVPETDILVVDDNSPDGTGRWCDEQAQAEPRLRSLHRAGKLGLGSATIAGMKHGLQHGYERIVTMDADFSHPPRFLPDVLAGLRDADVAIGSRYCAGGAIDGWPFSRRVISRGMNLSARFLLGLPVKDCSGAFRAYRSEILSRIDLDAIHAQGYAYLEEILWHLKRAGARFAETPITFVDRLHGQSKTNWREGAAAARMLARLAARNLVGC